MSTASPLPPSEQAKPDIDFNDPALVRHRKKRKLKDSLAAGTIGVGGISVIVAITLIFFYLLYEVAPLFRGADAHAITSYPVPEAQRGEVLYRAIEEQGEMGMQLMRNGEVVFFNTADGSVVDIQPLPLPDGAQITSHAVASMSSSIVMVGLSNGQALLFKHHYRITYPNDQRVITPQLQYPYGEEPLTLDAEGKALTAAAVVNSQEALMVIASNADLALMATKFTKETSFLTGETTLEAESVELPALSKAPEFLLAEPGMRFIYVGHRNGSVSVIDLRGAEGAELHSTTKIGGEKHRITAMRLLLGGASLLIAESNNRISQWFMVRDENNDYSLTKIREFQHEGGKIVALDVEHRRKGFAVVDDKGQLALFHPTSHITALNTQVTPSPLARVTLPPRSNYALIETQDGLLHWWKVENEHPEVSWTALWSKVWYEGYQEPDYIWQSSAANNEFEPKFSLSPLAFGTLKAAFYAMLVATPLAICGALYTAYFMSPRLRRKVKPSIELMEALPTVILGFLAGLFFAPFMENHLPGIFSFLVVAPLGILLFGFMWANLPERIRFLLPDGWAPILLIPVIIFMGWLAVTLSPWMEVSFFGGDMRHWLENELGIDFDQRNALVVGVAMGFAVIPTIFSITEDAIFSVPKHLTYGSLALGATPWQTMMRVILPTASPGIFSAVMIGMGRAVGETMIVLMATGNTPIMDINIFEGMRTLSANIAVEMPESEVGSTHYRILFLAAFVLFLFTFVVNTLAEWVRQRLRTKYSVI